MCRGVCRAHTAEPSLTRIVLRSRHSGSSTWKIRRRWFVNVPQVADELTQHGREVLLIEDDDVVQALAPERPNDAFHDRVRTR